MNWIRLVSLVVKGDEKNLHVGVLGEVLWYDSDV
jgi:hypothetical protein